jgi:biopolymer transport protein ExbB
MNTQFGLMNIWNQGDWVTKTVAILLLLMSLASWMVIVIKTLDIFKYKRLAREAEAFWRSSDFAKGVSSLSDGAENPLRQLAQQGLEAASHVQRAANPQMQPPLNKPQLHDSFDVSEWITRSLRNTLDEFTAKLQSGLAILASVGSTAPFVGLFGTVWGIYHALLSIGAAGQATIDKVAGPIGESLIMTALGLAVAIPAVLGYNALVRGNKGVLLKLNRFAHDLHAYFVTGARVRSNAKGG